MANRRILVVEDDPDGQEMIATVLQHMNFTVDTADDGEYASEILFEHSQSFDAVIIDLSLPRKDGWELLEEVLDSHHTSRIPCIAVTAFHSSKLREEALSAGFTAYFSKPIDSTQLGRELDRII